MEPTPRECGEQCQFDCYCKLVLKHEAVDYLRELKYRRDNETAFSALPQAEMDKLTLFKNLCCIICGSCRETFESIALQGF